MFALPYINGLTDLWYKLFRLVDIDWVILALYVQLFKSLSRRILISYKTRELSSCSFCANYWYVAETLQLLRKCQQD